jgi:hypothetical protein
MPRHNERLEEKSNFEEPGFLIFRHRNQHYKIKRGKDTETSVPLPCPPGSKLIYALNFKILAKVVSNTVFVS